VAWPGGEVFTVCATSNTILRVATDLFEVKEASDTIFRESNELLDKARSLQRASVPWLPERTFPGLLIGVIAAALAVVALIGLLLTIYRDQRAASRSPRS
jgi:twitching motility protein PilJ